MKRRHFLLGSASAAAFVLTGCLDSDTNGTNDTNAVSVDSRFSGEDCHSFRDTDETRCYHEVGTEPDVYLAPEQEAGNPAEEAMTFILHNDSDSSVWNCPFSECWDLHKLIDGEWQLLTPFRVDPLVFEPLEAGGSHVWNLEMSNDEVNQRDRVDPEDTDMAYTGMGRYGFSVSISTKSSGGGDDIELVALFEIDGEPLELEPVGVEEHEREGDTMRVRMEGDEETEGRVVYSARQVEGTVEKEIEPMLTEIAAQLHPVRNTVYFFGRYDTEEVRFAGNSSLTEERSILHRAANIYTEKQDESVIEVTEEGAVNDFPYRFRFLHDSSYYELGVEEYESAQGETR
jgi:hypothetical protein